MSTAQLPAINGAQLPAVESINAKTLEEVVCTGNLASLTPSQKVAWYRNRCMVAGLDPTTQPFQYLNLNGKLVLYATKTATDQLIALHKITVRILDRRFDPETGLYEVHCSATFPDGRSGEDIGVVPVGSLKGEALANGVMKACSKAKRRTVLSVCGLGMLDESEVDTIAGAERVRDDRTAHYAANHDNQTGHGSGAYAAPEVVKGYREWLEEFVATANQKWFDRWTGPEGEVREGVKELLSTFQVTGHLVKWGVSQGLVKAPPTGGKLGQRDKFAGVLYERWREELVTEATRYAREKWVEARNKLETAATPPPEEDQSQEVPGDDPGDPDDVEYPDDFPQKVGREPGED